VRSYRGRHAVCTCENCGPRPIEPPKPPKPPVPRQVKALRRFAVVVIVLLSLVVAFGVTEISLHGAGFFVFRSQGVGSTPDGGLSEDQGPGQPNSNGQHGCVSNAVGTCLHPIGKVVVHHVSG
jgi:hypothetical protein